MKARRSFGDDYECKYPWSFFVQCGDQGLVLSKSENYTTAFFEAFPNDPKCFLRGEGKTVEDAERDCWEKYQQVLLCDHQMDRRDRTDGYAYCRNCSYSSTVYEPLTKCTRCGVPAAYGRDHRNRWYCQRHYCMRPKDPRGGLYDMRRGRVPRLLKKKLKRAAAAKFGCTGQAHVSCSIGYTGIINLTCGKKSMSLLFDRHVRELLSELKKENKN